jgi:penicillin-binding protein 1A
VDAVSPQNAFIITSLLKEVVQSGTGAVCRQLGRPVAGKTGTTNEERDAWFIGFSPYLLTGVYIGFDQHEPMGFMETGSRAAAPTWLKYRFAVEEIYPAEDFLQPPGIVFRSVSAPPGEDDSPNPPKSYILPFIEGTQPAAEPEGKATKSK